MMSIPQRTPSQIVEDLEKISKQIQINFEAKKNNWKMRLFVRGPVFALAGSLLLLQVSANTMIGREPSLYESSVSFLMYSLFLEYCLGSTMDKATQFLMGMAMDVPALLEVQLQVIRGMIGGGNHSDDKIAELIITTAALVVTCADQYQVQLPYDICASAKALKPAEVSRTFRP